MDTKFTCELKILSKVLYISSYMIALNFVYLLYIHEVYNRYTLE